MPEEINGLLFTYFEAGNLYHVVDLNYSVLVGHIELHEGPGWILTNIGTNFLDGEQLNTLAHFIKDLPISPRF